MADWDGKCDEIVGIHSRPGKLYPWELNKAGTKWLCDWHYQQYKQEQERQRQQRERRQGPRP